MTLSNRRPRILLVKLSSFGDVLHTLPTLEALRAAYPEGRITWLVEAAYAPLLSGHPALDEVWEAPRLRPGQFFRGDNPAIFGGLLRRLRSRDFDLVVDLQGLLKSALWVLLSRSPRKVGYDKTREGSYLVLTERLPPYDPEAHAVWRYLNLARHLGAPEASPLPPPLPCPGFAWAWRLPLIAAGSLPAVRVAPWWCSIPGPAGPANYGPRRPGPGWPTG